MLFFTLHSVTVLNIVEEWCYWVIWMAFFFCLNYYGIDFTKMFWAGKFKECLLLHNLEYGFQSAASGLYVAHQAVLYSPW